MAATPQGDGPSRRVVSNQSGVHPDLLEVLARHRESPYRKPIASHTRDSFARAEQLVLANGLPIILDSGCGSGESTAWLAQQHPDHFVLGIDKSAVRLEKNPLDGHEALRNFALLRADLIDFWRLAAAHYWPIEKHFIFYPNPWPKKAHLKRRFHAHPVFFDLLELGKVLELRSNWQIYLAEFAVAFEFATGIRCEVQRFLPAPPISRFEEKYLRSGHTLFRLVAAKQEFIGRTAGLPQLSQTG